MAISQIENPLIFTGSKSYLVTDVVSDYGIYERVGEYQPYLKVPDDYHVFEGAYYKLKLIVNSRANAIEILQILDEDEIQHRQLNKDNFANADEVMEREG